MRPLRCTSVAVAAIATLTCTVCAAAAEAEAGGAALQLRGNWTGASAAIAQVLHAIVKLASVEAQLSSLPAHALAEAARECAAGKTSPQALESELRRLAGGACGSWCLRLRAWFSNGCLRSRRTECSRVSHKLFQDSASATSPLN